MPKKEEHIPVVNIWSKDNELTTYRRNIKAISFKDYHLRIAGILKGMTFPIPINFNLNRDKQEPLFVEVKSVGGLKISSADEREGFSIFGDRLFLLRNSGDKDLEKELSLSIMHFLNGYYISMLFLKKMAKKSLEIAEKREQDFLKVFEKLNEK